MDPTTIVVSLCKGWASGKSSWFDAHLASDFLFTSHLRRDCMLPRLAFTRVAIEEQHGDLSFLHLSAEQHGSIILSHVALDTGPEFTVFGPRSEAQHDSTVREAHGCVFASGWRLAGEDWQCFSHHELAFVDPLSGTARKTAMPSSDQAHKVVSDSYQEWAAILEQGEFERMNAVLADEFTMTSHVVPGLSLDKQAFIQVGSQIDDARLKLRSVWAEPIGDILLSRVTLDVEEVFKADLGPGMPSAKEITGRISGHRLGYASAWRRAGNDWQCFDHHMFGPVD